MALSATLAAGAPRVGDDEGILDIELSNDRKTLVLLLQLKLGAAGAEWMPRYTFVLHALALEKTDVLAWQVRDLQEDVRELKTSYKQTKQYWFADVDPSAGSVGRLTLTEKMTSGSEVFVIAKDRQQVQVQHTGLFQLTLQLKHRDSCHESTTTVTHNGTAVLGEYPTGTVTIKDRRGASLPALMVPFISIEFVQVKQGDTFQVTANARSAPTGSLMLVEI